MRKYSLSYIGCVLLLLLVLFNSCKKTEREPYKHVYYDFRDQFLGTYKGYYQYSNYRSGVGSWIVDSTSNYTDVITKDPNVDSVLISKKHGRYKVDHTGYYYKNSAGSYTKFYFKDGYFHYINHLFTGASSTAHTIRTSLKKIS